MTHLISRLVHKIATLNEEETSIPSWSDQWQFTAKKAKTQNYNTIFNVYYNIAHIDVLTNAETTIYTVKHQRKHELCE